MPSINQLTEQTTVLGSDQVPLYSTTNGQPRRASIAAITTYVANNIGSELVPVELPSYLLADLPSAVTYAYHAVYCLNGNAGQPCVAVSNGTDWKVVALGATVS
jgi:uncharacterized membrane protein